MHKKKKKLLLYELLTITGLNFLFTINITTNLKAKKILKQKTPT